MQTSGLVYIYNHMAIRILPYGDQTKGGPSSKPPVRGLGDLVAKVAQPIARAADAVLGTKVAGCSKCRKRQDALNKVFPNRYTTLR